MKEELEKLSYSELAAEISKIVHEHCKDVPHDIGLRVLQGIFKDKEVYPASEMYSNNIRQCVDSLYHDMIYPIDSDSPVCRRCGYRSMR